MKKLLIVAVASLSFSTTAMAAEPEAAGPVQLNAEDMDTVSAGVLDNLRLGAVIPVAAILANAGTAASIGLLSENVNARADAMAAAYNTTSLNLGDMFGADD